MKNFLFAILALLVIGFFLPACTSDKRELIITECDGAMPVWDEEVDEIIRLSCAYTGCHVSGSSVSGDYSSYGGISSSLFSGKFKTFVFDLQGNPVLGMPPDNAIGGPKDLTAEQLMILDCWMQAGFPEN